MDTHADHSADISMSLTYRLPRDNDPILSEKTVHPCLCAGCRGDLSLHLEICLCGVLFYGRRFGQNSSRGSTKRQVLRRLRRTVCPPEERHEGSRGLHGKRSHHELGEKLRRNLSALPFKKSQLSPREVYPKPVDVTEAQKKRAFCDSNSRVCAGARAGASHRYYFANEHFVVPGSRDAAL